MSSIGSDTVSEFGFTNSSSIGVFFTTCASNDNIKNIRTISRKIGLRIECFIESQNVYELRKCKLAQHSDLLPEHL